MSQRRLLVPERDRAKALLQDLRDRVERLERGSPLSGQASLGSHISIGGVQIEVVNLGGGRVELVWRNSTTGETFTMPLDGDPLLFNVKEYGATGLGVIDDSAGFAACRDAVVANGRGTFYVPSGVYRIATPGTAISFVGMSNVAVVFDPGAILLMDNLDGSGFGTGHGIAFVGPCSDVWVVNAHVKWATQPSARSLGDGIHIVYDHTGNVIPNDTNTVLRSYLINCTVEDQPQVGAFHQGVTEPKVVNFTNTRSAVVNTAGDGLHFNACRRVNVNGVTTWQSGDDSVALNTYYNATPQYSSSVVYLSDLGEWSNADSVVSNVISKNSQACGLRIAGAYKVAYSNIVVENASAQAISCVSTSVGTLPWQASKGITIDGVSIDAGAGSAVFTVAALDKTLADPAMWWQFDVALSNAIFRGTNPANDAIHIVTAAGVSLGNIRSYGLRVRVAGLRHQIGSIYCNGAPVFIKSSDSTGAAPPTTISDFQIGSIFAYGSGAYIEVSDISGFTIGQLRSSTTDGTGIQVERAGLFDIGDMHVYMPNRLNGAAASDRGVYFAKVKSGKVQSLTIDHDANDLNSIEIGGGDSSAVAADDLRIEHATYRNTKNQTTDDVVVQAGAYAPVSYKVDLRFYNGGEASPVWRAWIVGGHEIGYTEFTSGVSITATSEATATQIVSAGAIVFDGQPVIVEFFAVDAAVIGNAAGNALNFVLYDGSVSIGAVGYLATAGTSRLDCPVSVAREFSPAPGSHTYSIRGFRSNANCAVNAGVGGSGANMPGYIRITRAIV